VRFRRENGVGGVSAGEGSSGDASRERASVTECAASRQPLASPIVVDRIGQLYNKDALIACMLARASAFAHVRSLTRDIAPVNAKRLPLVCGVTRDRVTEQGRYVVGWRCGCVVASRAANVVSGSGAGGNDSDIGRAVTGGEFVCAACGVVGGRVLLGMPGNERDELRAQIMLERADASREKMKEKVAKTEKLSAKRKVGDKPDAAAHEVAETAIVQPTAKVAKLDTGDQGNDSSVYCSIFTT
jgi:hypothetical protein